MKKSIITIPLLLVATILTIFFGRRYATHQQEEMDENQLLAVEEAVSEEKAEPKPEENDNSQDQTEQTVEEYESRLDTLSLYEKIDYLSLINDEVRVAYFGDINIEEDWYSLINDYLDIATSGNLVVSDHTQPETDTYDLYIEQAVQAIVEESPDVVFYGLPALPDKTRDIGLADTEEYMTRIVNSLNELEDTELVLLEPYPIVDEIGVFNSRSLDYRSYLGRMQQVAEEEGLSIIHLHETFTERAEESSLDAFYDENRSINQDGTELVVTILDEWFQEEL